MQVVSTPVKKTIEQSIHQRRKLAGVGSSAWRGRHLAFEKINLAVGDQTPVRRFVSDKTPRLWMALIATCLFSLTLFAAQGPYRHAPPAAFRERTIATNLTGGYQVAVSDINHDGKPDLIAVASGLKELIWFENPGWQRHVIVAGISSPINCAAWDIDGDGIPEIALAHEFSNNPSRSAGVVSLLKHKGDPLKEWEMTEIDRLPTSHRLRWLDIDGNGKKVLVNAPLAGASATPPDYKGAVPLVFYRPGVWKRETISEELQGVLHGILATNWRTKGREDMLTASFLGIDLFTFEKDKRWRRTRLADGNPDAWPKGGAFASRRPPLPPLPE